MEFGKVLLILRVTLPKIRLLMSKIFKKLNEKAHKLAQRNSVLLYTSYITNHMLTLNKHVKTEISSSNINLA